MPTLYRTKAGATSVEELSLVVHCSSPRYRLHFQEFLRSGLGLETYALIAVPGGAQLLTLEEYLPKFSWAGWRWLKFLVDVYDPKRLVLVAHQDCQWYLDSRFGHDPSGIRERMVSDLRRARTSLAERFGKRRVELYYGSLGEDGSAGFEAV